MEKRNWFIAALGKNRLLSQPPGEEATGERLFQQGNRFSDIPYGCYQFLFGSGKRQPDTLISSESSAGNQRHVRFMNDKLAEIIGVVYGKRSVAFPKKVADVGETVKSAQGFVDLESRNLAE